MESARASDAPLGLAALDPFRHEQRSAALRRQRCALRANRRRAPRRPDASGSLAQRLARRALRTLVALLRSR